MRKKFTSTSTRVCKPQNILKIRTIQGAEFPCTQTLEKVFWSKNEYLGGIVIGFIDDEGDIIPANAVADVLWRDANGECHWIFVSEYEGELDLPEGFDNHAKSWKFDEKSIA